MLGHYRVSPDEVLVTLLMIATLLPAVVAVCCRETRGSKYRIQLMSQRWRYLLVELSAALGAVAATFVWLTEYLEVSARALIYITAVVAALYLLAGVSIWVFPTKSAYVKKVGSKRRPVLLEDVRSGVENPRTIERYKTPLIE